MFWAAATSTVEGDFLMNMEKMKAVNPGSYDHLMARQPKSWCRAYLGSGLACEAIENGIAECFNAIIVKARKRPLITMLEEIRLYVMERFFNLKETAEKWDSDVCPAAIKKMNVFGEDLRSWYVVPSGVKTFEVRDGLHAYGVDIQNGFCTCRLWEVSGIPCVHAQAAIIYTQQDPTTFISSWFGKEKFMQTYVDNIKPVNGSNMWEHSPFTKPLPPTVKRMPGRPCVKRKRHVSENQDKHNQQKGRTVQCTNCQQKGHNKASCKNPTVAPPPKEKKKMGRPRLDPDLTHWTSPRGGGRGSRGRGRGRGSRGGGRGGRGGGRGKKGETSTATHEGTSSGTQPDVMTQSDTQPPVEPNTQSEVEGHGMQDADKLHIQNVIEEMRLSKYTDAEIMSAIGICEAEFVECENFQADNGVDGDDEMDGDEEVNDDDDGVPVDEGFDGEGMNADDDGVPLNEGVDGDDGVAVDEGVVDADGVVVDDEVVGVMDFAGINDIQEDEGMAGVIQPIEEGDGVAAGIDEIQPFEEDEGMPAVIQPTQVVRRRRLGNKLTERRRRPSERINELKLKKRVIDPNGIGMSEAKALQVD